MLNNATISLADTRLYTKINKTFDIYWEMKLYNIWFIFF